MTTAASTSLRQVASATSSVGPRGRKDADGNSSRSNVKRRVHTLARGVIGNTPVFGTGIPSSSLGGPVEEPTTPMHDPAASSRPMAAIILAAGKGTRMDGDLPKVIYPVADAPMVKWVVDAVRSAGVQRIIVVVGYRAQDVQDAFADDDCIEYVVQHEQHGTGHAVDVCRNTMSDFDGDTFVLAGDGPLIRAETLRIMQQVHHAQDASATLATSIIDDPTGYGRIVRDDEGRFQAIVEHKNATDQQRELHEVYPSYALFDTRSLFAQLESLEADSLTGELYLTELPARLRDAGHTVELVDAVPAEDVLSINTMDQLAEVDTILRTRLASNIVEPTQ